MTLPRLASWNIKGFNSSSKVMSSQSLIKKHNLDMLFILEAKITAASTSDVWFNSSHLVFPREDSYNNFALSSPGRIWIKWNAQKLSFKLLFTSSQLIHGMFQVGSSDVCCVSVVYASNSINERQIIWNQIFQIPGNISAPWAILEGFNCCKFATDKAGGSSLHHSKLGELTSLCLNTEVFDLAYVGHFYTWFNQRIDNLIHIKLDRVFVNNIWLNLYPDSYYIVGDPEISDHCPIILQYESIPKHNHRLQYKNYWHKFSAFWDDVLNVFSRPTSASPIYDLYYKLKELKISIKSINWNSSNALQKVIRDLFSTQAGILSSLQDNPLDTSLNNALKSTSFNLIDAHSHWFDWISQRGKAKWLAYGEDDLKFLYSKIKHINNTSRIRCINANGYILTSSSEISSTFITHFTNLFNSHDQTSTADAHIPTGNTIPYDLLVDLVAPFTTEDIKQVIFTAPPNAARGPNDYIFEFYKDTWSITVPLLCSAVTSFFSNSFIPKQAKHISIALIPKHTHASSVADYRPISLCNSFYKIIAKLSTSGLRQRCPLSPYLFSIVMDGLSSCFDEAVAKRKLTGISLGNISMTHLLNADDLLVFAKANNSNARSLHTILQRFAILSRLNINPHKSTILFSNNCTFGDEINNTLSIQQTQGSINYLGLPISMKKLKQADFEPLIKKIPTALEGWKAKILSFAGRIQYLRYTIFSTIAYWIRGSIIPKNCCKIITKICLRFLFSRDISEKKLHIIAWKDTCIPKTKGGLGLPSMESLSHGFSYSIIWRFLNEDSLLFSWWRNRFLTGSLGLLRFTAVSYGDSLCMGGNSVVETILMPLDGLPRQPEVCFCAMLSWTVPCYPENFKKDFGWTMMNAAALA
ncbi:uncharacterized protein LOC110101296 [Dendrobium catenatum]|uniref:uncharacterized protein LOC110101296 n=1 Tax=Dendrobium catenatum TaxID=906689 RepID=UPI0009F529DB|nr:uncharacterized protein LOC110101296 [Dendrobium catenatum]